MSKIKFTCEDARQTFMHVDVSMDEPCFCEVADGYGAFARVIVKFNGTLIWECRIDSVLASDYAWDTEQFFRGLRGSEIISIDDPEVVDWLFDDEQNVTGILINFRNIEFDPETAWLVCQLITRHQESFAEHLSLCLDEGLDKLGIAA